MRLEASSTLERHRPTLETEPSRWRRRTTGATLANIMKTIEMMLRSHPGADRQHATDIAETLKALSTCSEICISCADACLGEADQVERLRRCITANLDCADICATTARVLTRQTEIPGDLLHAQLHACVVACQICADECETHSEMHDHFRICAETCRHSQERCNFLLGAMSSAGTAESASTGEDSPPLTR